MRKLLLLRSETSDYGTIGCIFDEEMEPIAFTMEPPWRNNEKKLSCLPLGTYTAKLFQSPRFGKVYKLDGTAPRDYILTHKGNLGGDIKKNFISHTEGCIILGSRLGWLLGQKAVLASAPAFTKFMNELDDEDFIIKIDAR